MVKSWTVVLSAEKVSLREKQGWIKYNSHDAHPHDA